MKLDSAHALLSSLLASFALAILGLLLLWGLAGLLWSLADHCAERAVERVRVASEQERVIRILAAQTAARTQVRRAAERQRRRLRLTDLNGAPISLSVEQIPAFQRSCCEELGLPAGSGWPRIRQQWRRMSLRWHPDHGGSTADWIRKQRAYEALRLLSETRREQRASLAPLLTAHRPASRRWWSTVVARIQDSR